MNRNLKKFSLLLTACGIVGLGVGCSGAGTTNNDQGLAVTFLGYFAAFSTSCTTIPTGLVGAVVQMSSDRPEPNNTIGNGVLTGQDAASNFVGVIGVQNNLYAQTFRADRILLDFYIAGASIQPPSTNVPITMVAGPGQSGATTTTDTTNGGRNPAGSSLPPSFAGMCNRVYAQATILPSTVREWISFNRDSLPEPPFVLEVSGRITGLSSAGDRFETQVATIPIDIIDEILVTPTEGSDTTGDTTGLTEGDTSESVGDVTSEDPSSDASGDATDLSQLEDSIGTDTNNGSVSSEL